MKENKKDVAKKDEHSNYNRRDLLKLITVAGAGALCPVGSILKLVIDKTIQNAEAQTITNCRNYVLIAIDGGPPRWLWDNPLIPNGSSDLFVPHDYIKTNFIPGGPLGYTTVYRTFNTNGFNMPYIWGLNVPTVGGGSVRMDELLPNMLTVRGVDMEADDHPGGNAKLTRPLPGFFSVSGLVADAGRGLIPAINVHPYFKSGANGAYTSEKGTGVYDIPARENQNYLTSLFESFRTQNPSSSFRNNALVREKIDVAINILRNYASTNKQAVDPIFSDRQKAEEMFRSSLVSIGAGAFDTLTNKYQTLLNTIITNAQNGNIPGITSVPVAGLSFPLTVPGLNKKLVSFGDLSTGQVLGSSHNFEGHLIGNTDVKSMFIGSTMLELAKMFALIEFVLVNRLTNSIVCTPEEILSNLNLTNSPMCTALSEDVRGLTSTNVNGNTVFNITSENLVANLKKRVNADSHATGVVPSIMCFSVFYMGLSSCLIELISQLKATRYSTNPSDTRNMFQETVIQIGGDFERGPTGACAAGSGHGWRGNSFTYLSGAINGFKLIGNLQSNDSDNSGTWGIGATVRGIGVGGTTEKIRSIHCANSICSVLRIKSVSTAEPSFLTLINDEVQIVPGVEAPINKVRGS